MENNVAVLGDADFVMPFTALGVDTFPTSDTKEQIIESAQQIIDGKYALVVVSENTAPIVEQVFEQQQNSPTPCVVVVPFTTEPTGIATKTLGKALKMATGINILKSD